MSMNISIGAIMMLLLVLRVSITNMSISLRRHINTYIHISIDTCISSGTSFSMYICMSSNIASQLVI